MTRDLTHPSENVPWTGRAVLHADLDAFFAAVEQLDHPEWRGLPVIVGGDPLRRGVVSTASYEARACGVRSAMPSVRAKQLCPDAIWAPSRFGRYREMSDLVFEVFRSESPVVQPVSVDEAFLDVTPAGPHSEHPVAIARRIRERVASLGLTVSVGVASSKTVAKIASDHQKPDGLTVVPPGDEAAWLEPLPVRCMSGVGPKMSARLESLGIRTLGDLARLDEATAEEVLGSHGFELVRRSAGIDPRPVREPDVTKQVSGEHTFSEDVRTEGRLKAELGRLSARVGRRLRRSGRAGRTVTVKLRFSDFTTKTAQRTLDRTVSDDAEIQSVAWTLVDGLWHPGVGVRLLGVGVSGFDGVSRQLTLLEDGSAAARRVDEADGERAAGLVRQIDAVRDRFGDDALRLGRDLATPDRGHDPGDETDGENG